MKLSRGERSKFFVIAILVIISFLLLASFITFIINISSNKSIIPFIFILLSIYSFVSLIYYTLYCIKTDSYNRKIYTIKPVYIIFFIINIVLFLLSYIVLWM